MSKNKFLFLSLLVLISLLLPNNIYADCTTEERNNFKKIESEFTVTYVFDKETKTYTINFNNPNPDNYGYMLTEYKTDNSYSTLDLTSIKEKEFGIPNQTPNKYDAEIYGITDTCKDKLKTIPLTLSKYNKYSEDPLCEDIEEFYLCQETYDKDIDYDTFVSRVNTYKKNHKEKQEDTTKEEEKYKQINKILEYIKDNLFRIIIIVVFIILIIITIILTAKSIRKSRRLE